MPDGRFVVGNESVPVDYEFFGAVTVSTTGKMTLKQTPLLGIQKVILGLLCGDLITEDGHAHRIELTKSDGELRVEFFVVLPEGRAVPTRSNDE